MGQYLGIVVQYFKSSYGMPLESDIPDEISVSSNDAYVWVRLCEEGARSTKVYYWSSNKKPCMIVDLIKMSIKEIGLKVDPIYTDIRFNDQVIPRDHLIKIYRYQTTCDKPFILEPNEAFKRKLRDEAKPTILKMKEKFDEWKPKRSNTIQTLNKLARESDEVQTRNSRRKFGGALTSAAVTIVSTVAGITTGGLAAPLVLASAGASIAGTIVTTKAEKDNSSHSDIQKKEVEKVIKNELNDYKSLQTAMQKLEEHLQNVCELNGWPASEAFPIAVSFSFQGVSLSIQHGRFFVAPFVAMDFINDHTKILKAVKDVGQGAADTIKGARQLLCLVDECDVAIDLTKLKEAIKIAEETAEITGKGFKTSKSALEAIEKTVKVVDDLSDVSKVTTTTLKVGEGSTKLASALADDAMGIVTKGTSLVTKASETAAKINRVVSPVLGLIAFATDCWDMYTSYGVAWGGKESSIGKYIREKTEEMEKELKCVEDFVQLRMNPIQS